ncbi:MAG: VWA domain-containing protein [Pseudomonadota bacterium]
MAKPPSRRSSSQEVAQFLRTSKAITEVVDRQPRLLFAIDATASRQPTWDRASHLQQEMFRATSRAASLSVQLCFYRGFNDFKASRWLSDSDALARLMGKVSCEGGHTQIARLLRHAQTEHRKLPLKALVFIGDAVEENPDTLCDLAGECGIRRLPLFLFQEGSDAAVASTFQSMAKLSGGAYARFDSSSAETLAALLAAVASFATGGLKALEGRRSSTARRLLEQLK